MLFGPSWGKVEKIREGERKNKRKGDARGCRVIELSGNGPPLDIWRRPKRLKRLASCDPQGGPGSFSCCSVLPQPASQWQDWHTSGGESACDSCSATLGSSVWTPGRFCNLFVEVSQPACCQPLLLAWVLPSLGQSRTVFSRAEVW